LDANSKNLNNCNTTNKNISNFIYHPVFPHYLLPLVAHYITLLPLHGFLCSNESQSAFYYSPTVQTTISKTKRIKVAIVLPY
jgi:hypothetical protein